MIGPRLSTNKICLGHLVSFCPSHFFFYVQANSLFCLGLITLMWLTNLIFVLSLEKRDSFGTIIVQFLLQSSKGLFPISLACYVCASDFIQLLPHRLNVEQNCSHNEKSWEFSFLCTKRKPFLFFLNHASVDVTKYKLGLSIPNSEDRSYFI